MDNFTYQDGQLFAEQVNIDALAEKIGTPFYCYSSTALADNYNQLAKAFTKTDTTICYALKANSNLAIVSTLAQLGAGADIVSQGELHCALAAGMAAEKIIFSGVGKTGDEMRAALQAGIGQFNIESMAELDLLSAIAAEQNTTANIALRINPDIAAGGHEKISTGKAESKFGIAFDDAQAAYAHAASLPNLNVCGIDIHIGSQITQLKPFEQAFEKTAQLLNTLRQDGHKIDRLDLGGGLGIAYDPQSPAPDPQAYAALIEKTFAQSGCALFIEPGRFIAGHAGILVASVIRTKEGKAKNFIIIDAAMTELMRPTLYNAHHHIAPTRPLKGAQKQWDIVGAVCETGDFLGLDRTLPTPQAGDLLAIFSTGAYGAVLGSHYNTRLPAPEIMVQADRFAITRPRPSYDALFAQQSLPDWLKQN